ncbi:MAG: cell division protein ZapA [Nitrospirota bacterium]|nr:cell division protein ZapA [Nitrospirota bacterium]
MGSVEISILGQKYTIKGDAHEEYIKNLAAYVEEKLQEIHAGHPNITPLKASILASLNIADELHKLKEDHDRAAQNIEEKTNALSGLFD